MSQDLTVATASGLQCTRARTIQPSWADALSNAPYAPHDRDALRTVMIRSRSAAAAASVLLAACGGGSEDAPPSSESSILAAQMAGSVTAAQFTAALQATPTGQALLQIAGAPKCGVDMHYVLYVTRDPASQPATASAGVLVPNGTDPACTSGGKNKVPVVLYAHGTTITRSKNMADIEHDSEALLQAAMFTAQGMIVVAPNYLGYDKSSLTYHPYLNAQAQATDMIDGLRAAKNYLAGSASPIKPTDQLLITGYSEGGHVAMATHRLIEASYSNEFKVTASGPMSGPYNLGKFTAVVDASPMNPNPTGLTPCPATDVNCWVNFGGTLYTRLLLTGYQKAYGNIYANPSQAYQPPYDQTAETLLPTDTPTPTLVAQGLLPNDPAFRQLFGTGGLITEAFRASFFTDPNNGLKAAVAKNTLLGWTPKRPVALCGGAQDPTVYYFNTIDAQADFASRGVSVPAVDVENGASVPGGPTGPLYTGFQAQKAQVAAAAGGGQAGQMAVLATYHGRLVPPFCTVIMRSFFQQVLASGQ